MQTSRDERRGAQGSLTPQVAESATRATEHATGTSCLTPRRIADKVLRINEQGLSEMSQHFAAGKLSVSQFLDRIGLSCGKEVTLALPHERAVTLRRAGRGDVIWVDPAISVDLVNALIKGKIDGARMRHILTPSDAPDSDHHLAGLAFQGFAIQGVLPKREDFTDQAEWKRQAIVGAAVAVHELAHVNGDAREYEAYKREFEYRHRLGLEPKASPQQLLEEIAHPPYTPRTIMQAVVDAARIEEAHMVAAERYDPTKGLWYGSTQGGRCAVLLRALHGKESGQWALVVSRIPLAALNDKNQFRAQLLLPISVLSISDAELRARAANRQNSPRASEDAKPDPERAARREVAFIADSFMARILDQSAGASHISRSSVQAVLHELGLVKSRFSVWNLLLDLLRA